MVYEQNEAVRELGVGINLLPNSVAELAEVGLLDQLTEAGIRTRELRYAHRLGSEILLRPCGLDAGFGLPEISIHRGRLQGVLYRAVRERLEDQAVMTGHRLTAFDVGGQGVRAHFIVSGGAAADPVRGNVLVAADGIHSTVRSALFPDEGPPRWNGVTMWRGATDWPGLEPRAGDPARGRRPSHVPDGVQRRRPTAGTDEKKAEAPAALPRFTI